MPVFNIGAEPLAKDSSHLVVSVEAVLVNVDFPADATSVTALRGDALELVVKVGLAKNHVLRFVVGQKAECFALYKPANAEEGEGYGFDNKGLGKEFDGNDHQC